LINRNFLILTPVIPSAGLAIGEARTRNPLIQQVDRKAASYLKLSDTMLHLNKVRDGVAFFIFIVIPSAGKGKSDGRTPVG